VVKVNIVTGNIETSAADAVIVSKFADRPATGSTKTVDDALEGVISQLSAENGDFSGELGEIAVLYSRGALASERVILLGLGDQAEFTPERLRRASAKALQKARSLKLKQVASMLHADELPDLATDTAAQALVEGSLLGLYHYHGQKSSEAPPDLPETLDVILTDESQLPAAQQGGNAGEAIAKAVSLTRDLVNMPPNLCTPAFLAETAIKMAENTSLSVKVLEREQMDALKMGALLAVAQGSSAPPYFIILEHNADKKDEYETIVFVGKGVTFDTGGYTLKTRDGMIGMKADMAGAAAVLGAMQAINQLDLPVHAVGLVPTSDNMISGNAYRPQEVVVASNGTSIEVISTDAEGRMLLADALVYAKNYEPAAVIDIATLTGASFVALGGAAAALYCTDDALRDGLVAAGQSTHERVWPMPLYEEYQKMLESETADTKNSGARWGGAGQAAMFLKNFVDYPAWAHVDMAGLAGADKENAYHPKGASGYGVRLFTEFARQYPARDE
jgi:leucyl aminopeptidase